MSFGASFLLKAELQDRNEPEGGLIFATADAPHCRQPNPETWCFRGSFSPCEELPPAATGFSPMLSAGWTHTAGLGSLRDSGEMARLNLLILTRCLANTTENPSIYFLRLNKNVQKYFTGLGKENEGKDKSEYLASTDIRN